MNVPPKAFCIDCFPQSFRRVYPDDSFFARLQKQGWETCTPQTMVNFQCNECRARVELAEKNAAQLAAAKAAEKEANERERKRLREQKKLTEKQRRQLEKLERENEMRERAGGPSSAGGLAGLPLGVLDDSEAELSEEAPGEKKGKGGGKARESAPVAKKPKSDDRVEQEHWAEIRKKHKDRYRQAIFNAIPVEIKERYWLYHADGAQMSKADGTKPADSKKKKKSKDASKDDSEEDISSSKFFGGETQSQKLYDNIFLTENKELIATHMFDLYFEPETDKTFEYLWGHAKHAKATQVEHSPAGGKNADYDESVDRDIDTLKIPNICVSCLLPLHKKADCPCPAERILHPSAPKDSKKLDTCPLCHKKHGRMMCKEMSAAVREEYRTLYNGLEKLGGALEGVSISYQEAWAKMHLDEVLGAIVNELKTKILPREMADAGLAEWVIDVKIPAASGKKEGEDSSSSGGGKTSKKATAGGKKAVPAKAKAPGGRSSGVGAGGSKRGRPRKSDEDEGPEGKRRRQSKSEAAGTGRGRRTVFVEQKNFSGSAAFFLESSSNIFNFVPTIWKNDGRFGGLEKIGW